MLSKVVDFEIFRALLEQTILTKEKKNNAGAKPYDVVLLFKILILQRYFGLSDEQVEYQIIDRTSFREFLGLASGDNVPDQKTVWSFRERLTRTKTIEKLFVLLNAKGLIINEGKMIDASFAPASGILGLMNLTYNLFRYEQIMRLGSLNIKCL